MKEQSFNKGTVLFHEGDPITGLHLIKTGEFELSKKYSKRLNEKYKEHAFPKLIKKDIKFWVVGRNEVLGLDVVTSKQPVHEFTWRCLSSKGSAYYHEFTKKHEGKYNGLIIMLTHHTLL